MKAKYKPGPGWKNLGSAVWENGLTRIHWGGLLVRRSYETIRYDHDKELHRYIRINGGNRKRGLMAFAKHI